LILKAFKEAAIVKPVLILAVALVILAVMVLVGFAKIESLWFVFPLSGIRISTLATAFVCFAVVLFLQRSSTVKSVCYGLLAVIFPMAVFEIMWYYSAAVLNNWDLRIMQFAALFGWVLLGLVPVVRRRPNRLSLVLYGVFILVFAVWVATGFKYNDLGDSSFSLSAEAFNVGSKSALFLAYAFHIGNVGLVKKENG